MKSTYTASVTSKGGRHGHITSSDGMLDVDVALVDGLEKQMTDKEPTRNNYSAELMRLVSRHPCWPSHNPRVFRLGEARSLRWYHCTKVLSAFTLEPSSRYRSPALTKQWPRG